MNKNILITNYELINYTGSELNTISIAKRFKQLGYKVYVLAMFIGEPLCSKTKHCYDEIIDMVNDDFDFANIEFDIVWAHHSFILSWLIFEKNIKAKKVIVSSLSAKENFEVVPIIDETSAVTETESSMQSNTSNIIVAPAASPQ